MHRVARGPALRAGARDWRPRSRLSEGAILVSAAPQLPANRPGHAGGTRGPSESDRLRRGAWTSNQAGSGRTPRSPSPSPSPICPGTGTEPPSPSGLPGGGDAPPASPSPICPESGTSLVLVPDLSGTGMLPRPRFPSRGGSSPCRRWLVTVALALARRRFEQVPLEPGPQRRRSLLNRGPGCLSLRTAAARLQGQPVVSRSQVTLKRHMLESESGASS
jgi:hypothetical protein